MNARPILSRRDDGIERLIGHLPFECDDKAALRGFASACTRSVSAFQIRRAQERAAEKRNGGAV